MAEVVDAGRALPGGASRGADATRRYAPLLSIAIALAIVLAVLPSSLNLPQSNPTQTLEYAPVPPDDEADTSTEGNFAGLGLGSSSAVKGPGAKGGDGPGGDPLPPDVPAEVGIDGDFRCAGSKPARQTEDPLAPPCVPFFDGDNRGRTYLGVTGNEIRLLVYLDGGVQYLNASNSGDAFAPGSKLFDLFQPPDPEDPEHLTVKSLRTWQAYFNMRFQRYKRRVHFYVYFSGERSSDGRRGDAAYLLQLDPFAVISFATEGFEDEFLRAMARKGILNFGSFSARTEEFFQDFPKMIWSYLPSVERWADMYVSYICQKAVGKPAVLAGGSLNGQTRKFGMLYTTDERQTGLRQMAKLVRDGVEKCGGEIVDTATFSRCCVAQDGAGEPSKASGEMATFQRLGITTVLWPGGINGDYAKAASSIGYQPEWIVAGDATLDANYPIKLSQSSAAFDGRAIVITPQTLEPALKSQRCYQAYREVDQTLQDSDLSYTCEYYRDLFQFFTGVQVAGPRLTPSSVDRGFREIPKKYYGEPTIPACFYVPGDYTCVKDAQAEIWRAERIPPGDQKPGCWAAIDDGQRFAPWNWPAGNINEGAKGPIDGDEPCNAFDTRVRFNT